jgi:hypothetical protein
MSEEKLRIRMDGDGDGDRRVLTRAVRGQLAVRSLATLCAPGGPRRVVDARSLEFADAFTAVIVRESIDRHLRRDRGHSVVLREPAKHETFEMLHDLLGSLPRRARWAGEADRPRRDRAVLLPAMRIADAQELRNTANFLGSAAAGPLRLPREASWLLAMAAVHFGDNALEHSPAGQRSVLLCACHELDSHDLQVVALSEVVPEAAREEPAKFLREAMARSDAKLGGLFSLVALARRREIPATLRIVTGSGRLFWRDEKPRFDGRAEPVPGFMASFEIHLAA